MSTHTGNNLTLLGCQEGSPSSKISQPPWEASSAFPRRNAKSPTSSKMPVVPHLPLLDQAPVDTFKALFFALPQTPPGNPPRMRAWAAGALLYLSSCKVFSPLSESIWFCHFSGERTVFLPSPCVIFFYMCAASVLSALVT